MAGSGELLLEQLQAEVLLLREELGGLQSQTSGFQEQLSNEHHNLMEEVWDKSQDIVNSANAGIANQLSSLSIVLGVVGLIGIGVGIWIQYQSHQVGKMLTKITNLKKDVEEFVNNKGKELYERFHQETVNGYFVSLVKSPFQIIQLFPIITATERQYFQPDYLQILKDGYEATKHGYYLVLIFKFYPFEFVVNKYPSSPISVWDHNAAEMTYSLFNRLDRPTVLNTVSYVFDAFSYNHSDYKEELRLFFCSLLAFCKPVGSMNIGGKQRSGELLRVGWEKNDLLLLEQKIKDQLQMWQITINID